MAALYARWLMRVPGMTEEPHSVGLSNMTSMLLGYGPSTLPLRYAAMRAEIMGKSTLAEPKPPPLSPRAAQHKEPGSTAGTPRNLMRDKDKGRLRRVGRGACKQAREMTGNDGIDVVLSRRANNSLASGTSVVPGSASKNNDV